MSVVQTGFFIFIRSPSPSHWRCAHEVTCTAASGWSCHKKEQVIRELSAQSSNLQEKEALKGSAL
jgi:hypothetical protein